MYIQTIIARWQVGYDEVRMKLNLTPQIVFKMLPLDRFSNTWCLIHTQIEKNIQTFLQIDNKHGRHLVYCEFFEIVIPLAHCFIILNIYYILLFCLTKFTFSYIPLRKFLVTKYSWLCHYKFFSLRMKQLRDCFL